MQDLLYENDGWGSFLLVTVLLGGGAAWLSGRAVAQTWRPWWTLIAYMLILTVAVRFFHATLFDGTFLSPHYYAVDAVIAILFASLGFRLTRQAQMARQYGFLDAPAPQSAAPSDATP